jgi:tetratricopeptide (TPR) repeat protein
MPLLIEWYRKLPDVHKGIDDPDFSSHQMKQPLRKLRQRVAGRYNEGTLQRLLADANVEVRRAAALALGLAGTFDSNDALAKLLHDEDDLVARIASDSLWDIWFRAGPSKQTQELQNILHLPDFEQILAGLQDLIRQAPDYVEAINQRAILYFRRGEYQRSIEDCERVLERNPHHFGAQSGMGECYLRMNRPHAALQAFRLALAINPRLGHVKEMVRNLEAALEES